MLDIDISKLEATWDVQKKFLKDGLIAGAIWDRSTGLPISGVNTIPEACALMNVLTEELNEILDASGFPTLGKFYLFNLEEEKLNLVIRHGDDLLQGMLLDPSKVNMGILFNVAIPKALAGVKAAR